MAVTWGATRRTCKFYPYRNLLCGRYTTLERSGDMGKDKGGQQSQVNKIVNYTQATHDRDKMSAKTLEVYQCPLEGGDPQEPSMSDILNEIKGMCTELVTKINTVAVNVAILHADLRKVVHRVTEAEDNIGVLNHEVATLKDTVSSLQKLTVRLEERAEDTKGRTCWNN
ncbi:hypothetical protein NDU88_004972, partial [Pleurodeles waltl]